MTVAYLSDAIGFQAASSGTGTFVFGNARPDSFTLAQAQTNGKITDGMTVSYFAQDSLVNPVQREWGQGTYSLAGNSVARTTVLGTVNNGTASIANSPLNFNVQPFVFLAPLAENVVFGNVVPGSSTTVIGGSLAGSTLTLESTSGTGSTDLITFATGSQSERMRIDTNGRVTISGRSGLTSGNIAVQGSNPLLETVSTNNADYDIATVSYNTSGSIGGWFFGYSRNATVNTQGAVNSGDQTGGFVFAGSDGTAFRSASAILTFADAAPATSTTPGRIVFQTTPAGSSQVPLERMRIDSSGFSTFSGRVGTVSGGQVSIDGANSSVQIQGLHQDWGLSIIQTEAVVGDTYLAFAKTRATAANVQTAVILNDVLGAQWYYGSDGTAFRESAYIHALCDVAPATSSTPGRIAFGTTPAGTSQTPLERMRIDSSGFITIGGIANVAPAGAHAVFEVTQNGINFWDFTTVSYNNSGQVGGWVSASTKNASASGGTAAAGADQIWLLHCYGDTGAGYAEAATLLVEADGSGGTGTVPGRVRIATTPTGTNQIPIERLRIDGAGRITTGGTGNQNISGSGAKVQLWNNGIVSWDFSSMTYNSATGQGAGWTAGATRGATPGAFSKTLNTDNLWSFWFVGDTGAAYSALEAVYVQSTADWSVAPALNWFFLQPTGYGPATVGVGGAVTQTTSRSTGVTLNTVCGAITLVSAAGSTTANTFTVTNSTVGATDVVILSQKSGTDHYDLCVTAVAAGSFNITFRTFSGTTTEQPVFNFAVIKAVAS